MNAIQTARHKKGMTLRQAAKRLSVDNGHLSRVERGVSEPSVALLRRMAKLYGLSVDKILGVER